MSSPNVAASENCLAIGTRLADFEITGILGEGGFGIVYSAFDHSLQRSVAIKEYMPGMLAMRGTDHSVTVRADRHQETFNVGLKSFINEARFLAQFDHASLVKVYRFWEQNQTAYTAMQYYQGRTLKQIVADSPELVTEQWCRRVLEQILDALETLYTMNILHRDVSPDNIIVHDNGDAVLLDFGSARQIIGESTRGLTVILKPGYAPVEQYAGDASLEQGPYTDIYALAAVMYFAIHKQAPATSIARMVKDPMVALAVSAPAGFGSEFLNALDHGLAVLAHQRPQTIDAFRTLLGIASRQAPRPRHVDPAHRFTTLERLPDGAGALPALLNPPLPPATGPQSGRRPLPRWMAGVLVSVVLVAILVGAVVALMGKPSDSVMVAPAQPGAGMDPKAAGLAPASAAPGNAPDAVDDAVDDAAGDAAYDEAGETIGEITRATVAAPKPAPAAQKKPPATPAVGTASYRLAIKPWGTVYVDGKQRGVSPPLKNIVLPAGRHTIRVVNPGFPDHVTRVNLAKNKSGTIEVDFAARAAKNN